MKKDIKIRNIILVGVFNPKEFDRYFFVKNDIVKEEEILDQSIFFNELVQLRTSRFNLGINRFQIVIDSINPSEESDNISAIISKLIEFGNLNGITSSGINFVYFVEEENRDITSITKELFYNPNNKIQNQFFREDNSTFGFYSSKRILDTELRLDVKPLKYKQIDKSEVENEAIQFEFNFHKEFVGENSKIEMLNLAKNYKKYEIEAQRIINSL